MKKLLVCLAAAALLFAACGGDDYPNGNPYFFLNYYAIQVPAEPTKDDPNALNKVILVTHDYGDRTWTATVDASWCTLTRVGRDTILLNVAEWDDLDNNRTAKITVTLDGITAEEQLSLYNYGEIAITQLKFIPDITDDLVGTYDAIGWLVSGGTAYNIARTITITAVEGKEETIFVTEVSGVNFFMDEDEEQLIDDFELSVKSSIMQVVMPTTNLQGILFTDTDETFVVPYEKPTYCDNMGLGLIFEVTVDANGMHTLTANAGGTQDWQGTTYNTSTVFLATDATGCLGGGLWGFGAIWTQVSKDPTPIVPQSIRKPIQISKYMESEPLPLNK